MRFPAQFQPLDAGYNLRFLRAIQTMQLGGSTRTVIRDNADIWDGTPESTDIAAGPDNSPCGVIADDRTVFFIGGGMVNNGNVASIAESLTVLSGFSHEDGIVAAWRRGATRLKDVCPTLYRPNGRELVAVGHSYGGGLAHVLYGQLTFAYRGVGRSLWTYGQPRVMDRSWNDSYRTGYVNRIFTKGDPVTRVPPHVTDQPLFMPLQHAAVIGLCNQTTHNRDGFEIDEDGVITPAQTSDTDTTRHFISFAAWLAGSDAFGAGSHNITTYIARFEALRDLGIPWGGGVAPEISEPPVSTPPAMLRQLGVAAIQANAVTDQEDPLQTIARLAAQVPPVRGTRYTGRKLLGNRVVYYGPTLVAYCSNKRKQRKLVRELNATLPVEPVN
jgi:hypothetical protein